MFCCDVSSARSDSLPIPPRPAGKASASKAPGASRPVKHGAARLEFKMGKRTGSLDADGEMVPSCMQTRGSFIIQQQEEKKIGVTPQAAPDDFLPDPEYDLTACQIVLITLGVVVPNVLLVVFFSDMGLALEFYLAMAPTEMSLAGDGLISGAAFFLALFYILDVFRWPKYAMAQACVFFYLLFCTGVVFKARNYPFGPLLIVLFHIPLCMGLLRATFCRSAKRRAFYKTIAIVAAVSAAGVLLSWILWIAIGDHPWNRETKDALIAESADLYKYVFRERELVYEIDCGPNHDLSAYSNKEMRKIRKACASANTVWFLAWVSPLIAIVCDTIAATFGIIQALMLDVGDNMSRLEKVLQQFILLLTLVLVGIYASASVSGASLRLGSTLAAFFAAGLAVLMVWAYVEIGKKLLATRLKESPLTHMVLGFWSSDWARAIMVGGLNVFIPIYLLLNYFKQRCMQCTGASSGSFASFTPAATKLLDEMKLWRWASILSKINIFGEVFFVFQVGVAKVVYVFLSWMNEELASLDYGFIILIVVLVGYTMFLLPPVPGVPVYVFSGIVLAEKARHLDDVGFHAGCWIATAVGFGLKLLACLGQYSIGYLCGKSIKIQQLICVDKVPTRAIEMILRRPGLDPGKVAILVGGPDWPTSVTCGILKLNVFQMLLGTCPVLFVLAPCVLAGAFMARVTCGEDSIWTSLASTATGLSLLVQMGAMCAAMYHITNVVQKHTPELAAPRKEHEAVANLTKSEQQYVETYNRVIEWQSMGCFRRGLIQASTFLVLLSCFVFCVFSDSCFLDFNISCRISDPIRKDGLDGNPFEIVLPLGWVALCLFLLGCLLHFIFIKLAKMSTKTLMDREIYDKRNLERRPSWLDHPWY